MKKGKEIFSNFLSSLSQKISSLNPVNNFIKFSLDKIFDELTKDHNIKLDDIRKGCVSLVNLQLDSDKINKRHLFSSPYILHLGKIGHLKIQLPSLGEIETKSIQVQIDQILLQLKPAENFKQNFKNTILDLKQHLRLNVEAEVSEETFVQHNKHDYFKELLKKMFQNLKIKVQNIVILIHLQNPSSSTKSNPHYGMLRIPMINLHQGGEKKDKETKEVQDQKAKGLQRTLFQIEMPQLTFHLMSLKDQLPPQGFPFSFPDPNHPSTILLFGLQSFRELEIETDETVPRVKLEIETNYKKEEKRVKVFINAPKVEFMISPIQVQTLLFFIVEINKFQEVLSKVKEEMGLMEEGERQVGESAPISMRMGSSLKRGNEDIFSSICISIWQSGVKSSRVSRISAIRQRKSHDMVDTIVQQNRDLMEEIQQFNSQVEKSINTSSLEEQITEEQIAAISFKNYLELSLQVGSIFLYAIKYKGSENSKREWMNIDAEDIINKSLPISYFLLSVSKLKFRLKEEEKNWKLQLSQVSLQHVKSRKHTILFDSQASSEQFCDVLGSSQFYQPQPESSHLDDHYCAEQMIRISHKPAENVDTQQVRMYSFVPNVEQSQQHQIYSPGLVLLSNSSQKIPTIKLATMQISVSLNSQTVKQILDFYLLISSMLMEDKLVVVIQKEEGEKKIEKRQAKIVELKTRKDIYLKFEAAFHSISVVIYQYPVDGFLSAVEKYRNGEQDEFRTCFCSMDSQGIYLNISNLQFNKQANKTKLSLRRLDMGLMSIKESHVSIVKSLFNINQVMDVKCQKKRFKLSLETSKQKGNSHITLTLPQVNVSIDQQTQHCFQWVKHQIDNLKEQLIKIQKLVVQTQIKPNKKIHKTEDRFQLKLQTLRLNLLTAEIQVRQLSLIKQINQISLSLSSLILSIRQNIKSFNCQIQNQQLSFTEFVETKTKNYSIQNNKIILRIHNDRHHQSITQNPPKNNSTKQSLKVQESSLVIVIKDSTESKSQSSNQNISLNLSTPVYISAGNALRLFHQKERFISFIERTKKIIDEEMFSISDSTEEFNISPSENSAQNIELQQLTVSKGRVIIDIRPTFLETITVEKMNKDPKKQQKTKQFVYSNTRSCLELQWDDVEIRNFLKNQQLYISGNFSTQYYFLNQSDPNFYNHKQLLDCKNLQEIGFTKVFSLRNLKLVIEKIHQLIRCNVKVGSINLQSHIETLAYLALHWEHFFKHDVKQIYGMTIRQESDKFQKLQLDDLDDQADSQEDGIIQDITHGVQIYNEKLQRKNEIQKQFRSKPYSKPKSDENCNFYLENLLIEQTTIKINKSITNLSYLEIYLQSFQTCLKLSEQSTEILTKVQNLQIGYCHKQEQDKGFLGAISKWWSSTDQDLFPILKIHRQIKLLIQIDQQKNCIKLDKTVLDIGFTSSLLSFVNQFKQTKEKINLSGWKKIYPNQDNNKKLQENKKQIKENQVNLEKIQQNQQQLQQNLQKRKLLLVYLPENLVKLTLMMKGLKMLQNKQIKTPIFLLHEQTHKVDRIKNFVIEWVKKLIKNNIQGLIASTAMDSFGSLVRQILELVKFLVSSLIQLFR